MGDPSDMVIEHAINGRLERVGGVVAAHRHVLVLGVAPKRLMTPILMHLLLSNSNK